MDFTKIRCRKFEIDGKFWIERVSTVPSTRLDLIALQEKFENCLKLNGAKPFGVCPIRRRIYDQLFGKKFLGLVCKFRF